MTVDGREQVGVATLCRGVEQARGVEHHRRFHQPVFVRADIPEIVAGRRRIGIPLLHPQKNLIHRRRRGNTGL